MTELLLLLLPLLSLLLLLSAECVSVGPLRRD